MKNVRRGIRNIPGEGNIRFDVVGETALHQRRKHELDETFGRRVCADARIEVARRFVQRHDHAAGIVRRRWRASGNQGKQEDEYKPHLVEYMVWPTSLRDPIRIAEYVVSKLRRTFGRILLPQGEGGPKGRMRESILARY